MPHIQQLSPHVADLIAAGEVVERPSSVVKELVENAIDAGSTAVVVEIQNGGMSLIRVTDNGCGIAPEELPTAFLRHATSKLRQAGDLAAIGTLGFRGEALAAISAVSRMDVLTCQKGSAMGAALHLEGGVPDPVEDAGCPEGSTFIVRELFYNTPARLKFMKTDSAEAAAVGAMLGQIALSHPEVSIRYLRDGKEELHTPGDGKLLSAIYAARGRDFALRLTQVDGGGEGVTVRGFVTEPLAGRGTRAMQTFFCCGRMIKSAMLTAALEEAYANRQMKGKFPGCVLHIDLPLHQVDVNVHPAKTVVKFVNERAVFSAVHHTVKDALDAVGREAAGAAAVQAPPERVNAVPASPAAAPAPKKDFYQTMDAKSFREQAAKPTAPRSGSPELGGRISFRDVRQPGLRKPEPPVPAQPRYTVRTFEPEVEEAPAPQPRPEEPRPVCVPEPEAPAQTALEAAPAPWRFAGEVLRTYIIAEDGDTVWLIDKHAAHERINFDRMKANTEPIMRQQLLAPLAAELPREQYAVLLENLPLLEEFGFEAEDFGEGCLMVRAVPADLDAGLARETLEELADKLLNGGGADPAAARDVMLHTMACKAAIKGGWTSDPAELRVLIDKVQSGEVQFCPHGRPVKVKLSKYEIEKMFKRA
ncbi:MAG: DNA mismatch repair endonuclease MutL [Oscillospiraceae bacterium]|nr:DNA mismatch repair endonuclease MutL [Oscillospiraceae bacterium]